MPHPPSPDSGPTGLGADPGVELEARLRRATLGEYDILALLGTGGMANVYLAHDLALDRRVAIKVMSPAMVYGAGLVERFRQEARTAAALSHPNIIPVYAVRETDGLLYFVMKVVDGTSLDAVIAEAGQLPIPMVEAILAQVGGALGYAHRHGVIHRDVKPANILLDEEGWVVVTDFGIAKVAETSGLTVTGTAVGTPTYMSPEQCAGGDISGASDQYSLGVVAYEMITGVPPFVERSVPALMVSHTTREPPSILAARPECPAALASAVTRMLTKDPTTRFPCVEDAITAAEARPLAPDDPTRSTMVALARNGSTRQMIAQVRTPRSPVPLIHRSGSGASGTATPVAQSARGNTLRLVGGIALGVLATAAVVLVLGRGRGTPATGVPDSGSAMTLPGDAPVGAPVPAAPPGTTPTVPMLPPPPSEASGRGRPVAQPPAAMPEHSPRVASVDAASPRARVDTAGAGAPPGSNVTPTAPSPAVAIVPPPPATTPPTVPPPAPVAVTDPRPEIEAVIRSYARALESGRLEMAIRIFPAMPAAQREGLTAFYRDGGTMRTAWQVTDVVVDGTVATLQISGTNTVQSTHTKSTAERVNLRARLERGAAGWRLVSLTN
ncbi:MAG TPA: protein kinase [Gemmatimonadales bacterium]|nr:protein kinase [Gemmatimonadales bacterium]